MRLITTAGFVVGLLITGAGALSAQMTSIHIATMTAAWRLSKAENSLQRDHASAMLNKCSRTFTTQMETLKRWRANGQDIRVQHVTINDGGQAIVTENLQAGGGAYDKSEHRPLEPSASAPEGQALLGNIQADTQAMPSTSGSRVVRMPLSRGIRRRSNGQS